MSQDSLACAKCNGQMERGFDIDRGDAQIFVGHWVAGAPLRSFLTSIEIPGNSVAIGTFRCSACGYLETYALPELEQEK
jgi:hypothetical protein